jgi:hypothetical protein
MHVPLVGVEPVRNRSGREHCNSVSDSEIAGISAHAQHHPGTGASESVDGAGSSTRHRLNVLRTLVSEFAPERRSETSMGGGVLRSWRGKEKNRKKGKQANSIRLTFRFTAAARISTSTMPAFSGGLAMSTHLFAIATHAFATATRSLYFQK